MLSKFSFSASKLLSGCLAKIYLEIIFFQKYIKASIVASGYTINGISVQILVTIAIVIKTVGAAGENFVHFYHSGDDFSAFTKILLKENAF